MMKILILSLMLLGGVVTSSAQILEMDSVSYNFGQVSRRGADIIHRFRVRNSGDAPLVITEAPTTCTCIKVKYPKRPIPPQSSDEVVVKYEVQRKEVGPFHKVIKILSNSTKGDQILTISGVSVEK